MHSPRDPPLKMPPGHRLVRHATVTSTNEIALRLANEGEPGGLWVMAKAQAGGRGRGGRGWASPPGNLYASFLLRPDCPLGVAQQLTLVAPVALHDAVAGLLAGPPHDTPQDTGRVHLRLKWPNDLLVDGAKVSGILLESAVTPAEAAGRTQGRLAIVMGFGLNLVSHPPGLDQSVTHLAAHGGHATPARALAALAHALRARLASWANGAGFAGNRQAWLDRAGPLGEPLSIRTSPDPAVSRLTGTFAGLDGDGALLLDHDDGARSRHTQGDVALMPADR